MRRSSYVDSQGRHHAVWLPDDIPESDANLGLPAGPPDLHPLGLPEELEIRLHNEMFQRNIFTFEDAMRHREHLSQAVRAVLRVNAERLLALYLESSSAKTDNQNRPGGRDPRKELGGKHD